MLDNNFIINVIDEFINELKNNPDSVKRFIPSEIKQELYVQITNKLSNLFFSIDRVENNIQYQSDRYYEDILLDIRELEELEKKYPNEWTDALKRAVEMYLNTALINITNSNQEQKDYFFNQAIYALSFCKDKNVLKEKYYNKIEQ